MATTEVFKATTEVFKAKKEARCVSNNSGEGLEDPLRMANAGDEIEMGNVNEDAEQDRRGMGHCEVEIYEQMELMADDPADTPEVTRQKRVARVALTVWPGRWKELQEREGRLMAAVSCTKNEMYQLMSLYSVFAGVVLTAVATSSRLECQHLWSPIGLCAFIYGLMIAVMFMKFQTIDGLQESIESGKREQLEIDDRISHLKTGYMNFNLRQHCQESHYRRHHQDWHKRCLTKLFIVILLTSIFTAGLIGSFIHILCKT